MDEQVLRMSSLSTQRADLGSDLLGHVDLRICVQIESAFSLISLDAWENKVL